MVTAYTQSLTQASCEWYTPPRVVDVVHEALGGAPDLDPASSVEANAIVRATEYYDRDDDGLSRPWKAERLFCNPPGERRGDAKRWWRKLSDEVEDGNVKSFVFLGYNINILQQAQIGGALYWPTEWVVGIPKKRIEYVNANGTGSHQPPCASVLIGMPARLEDTPRMVGAFELLGAVMVPFGGWKREV